MKKLSPVAIKIVACAALAGVSYLAGRKEGFEVGKENANSLSEQIGYMKALSDVAKQMTGR